MRYFVTGCAGFIASHLVDRLLELGHEVIGYDNFSTGFLDFLEQAIKNSKFTLITGDLLDVENLTKNLQSNCQAVFHFAANADIKLGIKHPDKDLKQNILATFNVLEVMR